jgi:hypothetical protein
MRTNYPPLDIFMVVLDTVSVHRTILYNILLHKMNMKVDDGGCLFESICTARRGISDSAT